jgi:hypothetical protein
MAKKYSEHYTPQEKALTQLDLKGLKRECIVRGMDFQELAEADIPKLQSWFLKNYLEDIDVSLLSKFDEWLDQQFEEQGYDKIKDSWAFHPSLRFSRAEVEDDEEPKAKRVKLLKKPKKKKAEKVEGFKSLRAGTKKSYTYLLTSEGYNLDVIVRKVVKSFPDAKENSISIWYKKCLKEKTPNHEKALRKMVARLKDKGVSLKKITQKALLNFKNPTKEEIKTVYNEL